MTTCSHSGEEDHPAAERLFAFAKGRLEPQDALEVLRHVLSPCPSCQRSLARSSQLTVLNRADEQAPELKVLASQFLADEQSARASVDRLMEMDPQQQGLRLRNTPRLQTSSAISHLIERAYECRFSDLDSMQNALDLAGQSLQAATIAGTEAPSLLSDLAARLSSHLGNLASIRRDLPRARLLFRESDLQLAQGTGDPIELANSLKLRIAMEMRSRAFDEAHSLCDRAASIYRRCGDAHSEGEVFLLRAAIETEKKNDEAALKLFSDALPLLDPEVDAATVMAVRHNRVILLRELDRTEEALTALRETLPLYGEGWEVPKYQMVMLSAQLARDLGQSALSERSYLEALNGFMTFDRAPLAAEASLELAALYLEQNRNSEARRIAKQTLPILRASGMRDEAYAALLVFREATLRNQLSLGLVSEALRVVRSSNESA